MFFQKSEISIKNERFTVEIAKTPEQMERGLMYRKSLDPEQGMLFIFKSPQIVGMWMKNTLIPLDMIFINDDWKIAEIHESALPESEITISSKNKVIAVLELAGGTCRKKNISVGDVVARNM